MTDIFSDEKAPATPSTQVPNTVDTLLDSIKNESGQRKYSNIEEALKALQHSQEYIPTLKATLTEKEQRLKELEEAAAKATTMDEIVAKLSAQPQQPQASGQPPKADGLDEQAVVKLVQQTLSQAQVSKLAQDNVDAVQTQLVAKYGDKVQEVIKQKAEELGISPKDIGELAKKSPAAALAMFGTQAKTGGNPTTGSVYKPPLAPDATPEVKRPEKSILQGSSTKAQVEHLNEIKKSVYARLGVTS